MRPPIRFALTLLLTAAPTLAAWELPERAAVAGAWLAHSDAIESFLLEAEVVSVEEFGSGLREPYRDGGFHQQLFHRCPVEGQRGLQVGLATEQDQSQAVPGAAPDEPARHALGRREPVHHAPLELKVLHLHGPGQVHRQQQIAAGHWHLHRLS